MSESIERLRKLCGGPRDGALLRVTLANELIAANDSQSAIFELHRALEFDSDYSMAWKLLGKMLADSNEKEKAIVAYRNGIAAAIKRGDKQAEKEMTVFLRRLEKLSSED
jgi:predicted Zn-dependent protease